MEGLAWIEPGKSVRGVETCKSFEAEAPPDLVCR